MTWEYRPEVDPQAQLKDLGDELGIENLKNVDFDATTGYLTIFTQTSKFRVLLTEVT